MRGCWLSCAWRPESSGNRLSHPHSSGTAWGEGDGSPGGLAYTTGSPAAVSDARPHLRPLPPSTTPDGTPLNGTGFTSINFEANGEVVEIKNQAGWHMDYTVEWHNSSNWNIAMWQALQPAVTCPRKGPSDL
ncbi:hypothetical protein GCM10015535_43110 [Streptomyces gelaticus]|uniref:Chitin-binding type-4 domain-containing protein n=1 Tax=Streptomyces gelaticus TaxID=285446 RepID=A0ABQ2W2M3_9ACTN|nr:hypothetical protein GCM10015535_43110 [Streptomyces gelaticus]